MFLTRLMPSRWKRRHGNRNVRSWLYVGVAIFLFVFPLVAMSRQYVNGKAAMLLESHLQRLQRYEKIHRQKDPQDKPPLTKTPLTVSLVLATVEKDDVSWAEKLKSPTLNIVRYVADRRSAQFHPTVNKGNEAMIYHTYFYDFYDDLPDISILAHASDRSWHMDALLDRSIAFAVSNLNLHAVKERGYSNLHVGWRAACPDWIRTTTTVPEKGKPEQIYMREAFLANFARNSTTEATVPLILAQPCCSQFAVSREAIRSVPREEYARLIKWLEKSKLEDQILGRIWEHLFQQLFTNKAVDCPVEWKTYCKMYNICFESKKEYDEYMNLESERSLLEEDLNPGFEKVVYQYILNMVPLKIKQMEALTATINHQRDHCMRRGSDVQTRNRISADLYRQ